MCKEVVEKDLRNLRVRNWLVCSKVFNCDVMFIAREASCHCGRPAAPKMLRERTKFAGCAFSIAGPSAWNSRRLISHLFRSVITE